MKMLRGITKGLPQSGLQGGAGIAVFYLHRMLASKFPAVQNHPLAAPIGFIAAGHVLKKSSKLSSIGSALIGAGGYAAAQVYEVRKAQQAQPAPAQTSGLEDTGALTQAADIGALVEPSNIGEFETQAASAYDEAYTL